MNMKKVIPSMKRVKSEFLKRSS